MIKRISIRPVISIRIVISIRERKLSTGYDCICMYVAPLEIKDSKILLHLLLHRQHNITPHGRCLQCLQCLLMLLEAVDSSRTGTTMLWPRRRRGSGQIKQRRGLIVTWLTSYFLILITILILITGLILILFNYDRIMIEL